ncbi:DNA polymerase III subunit chi, partial [Providencia rettgeri]|uniref:DNA polymerase III subunit chi n=1 Tax=Providencia rettgeri TaxID=587 RepID=UPI0032DBB80E
MKKGTFYQLQQPSPQAEYEAHEWLACELAAEPWRNGKPVLIACEDQLQAEKMDEALWQRDPHQFVPHNLAGEGPRYGSPIEICWPNKRGNTPRDILINLQSQFADFATAFHEVIDFVPIDETLKQLARDR